MKKSILTLILLSTTLAQASMLSSLVERREEVRGWSVKCANGQYSENLTFCDQHDMNLFAGLGCLAATLAGDKETIKARCEEVRLAQGSNGRWWRGPIRVDDNIDNSFSRDMSRGTQAFLIAKGYLGKTKEEKEVATTAAKNWLSWITSDEGDNKLCTIFTKNRCRITIGMKNLFYNVFSNIGALPAKGEPLYRNKFVKKVRKSKWYLRTVFLMETKVAERGYPRHLKSASVLMYRVLNMRADGSIKSSKKEKTFNRVSRALYRMDRENNLFEFLYKGVSQDLVNKVLNRCPKELPNSDIEKRDFQWQRMASNGGKAYMRADGHDCVYLLNLMIAKLQGGLTW